MPKARGPVPLHADFAERADVPRATVEHDIDTSGFGFDAADELQTTRVATYRGGHRLVRHAGCGGTVAVDGDGHLTASTAAHKRLADAGYGRKSRCDQFLGHVVQGVAVRRLAAQHVD